jgi:glutathione S-transferase
MADRFDPAEFDTPAPSPTSAPGDDYRVLLDAMRQAGAEGVAQPIAALVKRLEEDAHDRARFIKQARADREQLHAAASRLAMASDGLTLDRIKEWLAAALISLAVILTAAVAWRWAQEPKIVTHAYGCSTGWDTKKAVCKGKWVPLVETPAGQ